MRIFLAALFIFGAHLHASANEEGGIKFYADYLYWQVTQDELQYAVDLPGGIQQIIDSVGGSEINLNEHLNFKEPTFSYNSGFRIGLDCIDPCSQWDIGLSWTRLHQKVSSHLHSDVFGIIPLTLPASVVFGFLDRDPSEFGFASNANSRWHYAYDVIDLQLGFNCVFYSCLHARPYVGLKAASIRQKQDIVYDGFFIEDTLVMVENSKRNHFQGIGPSAGLDASIELFSDFSISGRIGGAILYGKFDSKVNPFISLVPNLIEVTAKASRKSRLRPEVDACVSLDWNSNFCDQFNLLIGVGYELQYWWNQWQVPGSIESSILGGGVSPKGDLMMQGLTVRAAVTF